MKNFHKIIITGGSSGLGLALATHYAGTGAQVAIIARNADKLSAAAQQVQRQTGRAVLHAAADVVNPDEATQALVRLIEQMGGVDLLINNAGILLEGYFENLRPQDFQQVMEVNVFGVINVIQACLPELKLSQGKIVNVASMAGYSGVFGYTAYSTSKHALIGFSESLRYELKPQGVSVQIICPPEFDSPMVDTLDQYRTAENRAHAQMIPKSSLEHIAQSTINAIGGNQFVHFTGWRTGMTAFFLRHFPRLVRYFADRIIRQHRPG
jgi:3-dehydrosphinganine reductase